MRLAALALLAVLGGPAIAAPVGSDAPPDALLTEKLAGPATLDAVMKLVGVQRMAAKFVEDKYSALLARPLVTEGTLVYDRARGLVRTVGGPRPQQVVVTQTALIIRSGGHTETVPLGSSKELQAFALVFPALLRGDRDEISRAFELAVRGSEHDWWALTMTPKAASLRAMIAELVVIGRGREVRELRVVEASGDHSDMRLDEIRTDAAVTAADLAAFSGSGAP